MAEKARETSMQRMLEHAARMGGNAVVAVRYDTQEIMQGMTEVLCYGTAVVISNPDGSPLGVQQPVAGPSQGSAPNQPPTYTQGGFAPPQDPK
ncbi:hypothetical protein HK097_003403 [Rhizophlyctis rosea]|uniref:Heavy metal-binding domain-containing protein n=1 Tax=Rhizophlyctis rosea TaxID=64517 RepID=A0AAD5SMC9_9FUNG|nr:hypothetical protein HK097_003403 [Rhizophlyctis rosea]